jgi:hypothetical protein
MYPNHRIGNTGIAYAIAANMTHEPRSRFSKGDALNSRNKQKAADSAASISVLNSEFKALGILEHGNNDVMGYFGDRKRLRYRQRAFNHIALDFGKGSPYSSDG